MLVKSVSYFLIIVLSLVEVHSLICVTYKIGEVNCTNDLCKHPEECACSAGYTKRNDTCVPVCKGECLHGICVAPNTCRCDSGYNTVNDTCVKKHILSISSKEDTTTTTKNPYNRINTPMPTSTSPVPYFVSSSISTVRVVDNDANTTVTSGDSIEKSCGEVCKPICKLNCTNDYCKHPEECACNAGYTKRNDTCVPVCKGECLHGTCVAPNRCRCDSGYNTVNDTCVKKHISRSSKEDTTTTTKDPYNRMNTPMPTSTSPVPYFVSSSISTVRVVDNDANTTVTSGDSIEKSWMQQHGMFIWIPILVIVTTGLVLLLVWQRIPTKVINFFKRRSYNVQGAFLKRNGSSSFESLEFIIEE